MKKCSSSTIPILTMSVWWVNWDTNYGSLFQAYALQTIVKKLGHEPTWIQHCIQEDDSIEKKISSYFSMIYRALRWPIRLFGRRKRKKLSDSFRRDHPRYFEEFIAQHLNVAKVCCKSLHDLEQLYKRVGCAIVGSDQMWISPAKQNFLSFIPEGKRIAYAVSAPWEGCGYAWRRAAMEELPKFASISVREKQGVELLHKLGMKDAVQCLDPVFLLEVDEWNELANQEGNKHEKGQYCLGYFLNGYKKEDVFLSSIEEYCEKKQLELVIVPNQGAECYLPAKYLETPSPSAFLALFRDAACVVTNSFHAVVFSIIFRKRFVIVPQLRERRYQNTRFESLLDTLQIPRRVISNSEKLSERLDDEIDYDKVWDMINNNRELSISFLRSGLEKCCNYEL